MSVRQVRAALRERGQASVVDEEEEEQLDPFVTTDLGLESREHFLAVESARMAIQLMRQIRGQLSDRDLKARFAAAIDLLNRDEVDARRQLELG